MTPVQRIRERPFELLEGGRDQDLPDEETREKGRQHQYGSFMRYIKMARKGIIADLTNERFCLGPQNDGPDYSRNSKISFKY